MTYPINPDFAGQFNEALQGPSVAAQNYASANLAQQQAQAAAIQNYKSQLSIPLLRQLFGQAGQNGQQAPGNVPQTGGGSLFGGLAPASNQQASPTYGTSDYTPQQGTTTQDAPQEASGPGSKQDTSNDVSNVENSINSHLQNSLTKLPTDMPEDVANQYATMKQLAGLEGSGITDKMAEAVKDRWLAQVNRQNEQREVTANNAYTVATDVAKAPLGLKRATLKLVAPGEEAQLPDDFKEEDIDDIANKTAATSFRYTGRGADLHDDGYFYDHSNGQRITGDNTKVGISPKEYTEVLKQASEPTGTITDNNGTRPAAQWEIINANRKAQGLPPQFHDAGDYARYVTQGQGSQSGVGSPPQAAAPNSPSAGQSTPPAKVPAQTSEAPQATAGPIPAGPVSNLEAPLNYSSVPQAPKLPAYGTLANPTEYNLSKTSAQNVIDANDAQKASIQNGIAVDKDLLQNQLPNAASGPGAVKFASLQTLFQNLTGDPVKAAELAKDPAATQIMNKRLNFDALGGMEQITKNAGGTRGSAMMANIAIKQLSANADLAMPAIQYLVKWDLAHNLADDQKTGQDFLDYQKAGGDPNKYDTWYSKNGRPLSEVLPNIMSRMDSGGNVAAAPKLNPTTLPGFDSVRKSDGWLLLKDKHGGFAYVNPNNTKQYEEL